MTPEDLIPNLSPQMYSIEDSAPKTKISGTQDSQAYGKAIQILEHNRTRSRSKSQPRSRGSFDNNTQQKSQQVS